MLKALRVFAPSRFYILLICALISQPALAADAPKINYTDHILPIFRNACLNCHNADKRKGGLDLASFDAALKGSDGQKVILPGDADGSVLYKVVAHLEEPKMPQKADKLSQKDIDLIKFWIAGGALETATGKPIAAAKPKLNLAVKLSANGKPAGPPAMPAGLPLDPIVRTKRSGAIASLASSPWAPLAALGGQRQVFLYNTDTLDLLGVIPFAEGLPNVLKFSRNGSLLLAGGGEGARLGKVAVYDVTNGKRIFTVGDEFDAVLAADISPDQTLVALGGPSKMLRVFSSADGQLITSIKKHTDWVTAVAYSPDNVLLASGDRAGNIVVWEARNNREFYVLNGHKAGITALEFRGDSNLLASASEDGTIKLWHMENGSMVKNWTAHAPGVMSVNFTHDGRLVSTGRDRLTRIWNPDGAQIHQLEAFPDIGLKSAFSHDGGKVIAGDWSGQINVWTSADGKRAGELSLNPPTIAERLAATEKLVTDLQTTATATATALAAATDALNKSTADLTATQKIIAESPKAIEAAKAALAAANTELQQATNSKNAAAAALPTAQAESDKQSAALKQAIAQRDQTAITVKTSTDAVQAKQKAADVAVAAATAAKAASAAKPDDKPLAEAAAKAQSAADKAIAELAASATTLAQQSQQFMQQSESAKKLDQPAVTALATLTAAKLAIDQRSAGLTAAAAKIKSATDTLAAQQAQLDAAQKSLPAKQADQKAKADAATAAKTAADAAAGQLANAKAQQARLKAQSGK